VIEIAWLDASLAQPDWPRRYPLVLDHLRASRASGPRHVATEHDIEGWDWRDQAITLSVRATRQLESSLPSDDELDGSVRELMRMHAGLGWGCTIGLRLHTRGFLVSLAGSPLYGGVCLEAASERVVEHPVLRSGMDRDRAVFHVLPVHLPFLRLDPGAREIAPDMVVPEARADWPMPALAAHNARGPAYEQFSTIVHDPRLRDAVGACGIPLA